jgi:calcineurin-like phosphoesterase family protein
MPSVYLIADPHFGHRNICKFHNYDGTKTRPWDDVDEMDEEMVKRWNGTVKPADKVYMLGDIVINRKALAILDRLNGDKVLIKGNHDIFKLSDYTKYFRDIRAYHVMNGLILSHIPVHESSLARFRKNIHGHLHNNQVKKAVGFDAETKAILYGDEIDPRYYCVSVEQINYTPILFEEVMKRIEERDKELGFIDDRESILGPD